MAISTCIFVSDSLSMMTIFLPDRFSPFADPSHLPPVFCPPVVPFTDGCPNLCNGNGQCTMGQQSWHCECQTGWRGPGCSVAMETSCADNKDNEGGGKRIIKTESVSRIPPNFEN